MGDIPSKTSDDDYLAQQPVQPAKAPDEGNSNVGPPRLRAVAQVARAVGRVFGLAPGYGGDNSNFPDKAD